MSQRCHSAFKVELREEFQTGVGVKVGVVSVQGLEVHSCLHEVSMVVLDEVVYNLTSCNSRLLKYLNHFILSEVPGLFW